MTHVPCTPAAEIPETLAPTGALGLTSAQLQARLDEIHPVGSIAPRLNGSAPLSSMRFWCDPLRTPMVTELATLKG